MRHGWEIKKLNEVCSLITKGSSPKWQGIKYVEEPGILFVTSENVGEGQLLLENRKYVEAKFNQKDKKSILQKGDVLTNIVGASIGRTAIFDLEETANINQAVCILRCKQNLIYNTYLMNLLNSPFLISTLHSNEVNTARANLSLGFFSALSIPLPPLPEQKRIVAILDEAFSGISRAKEIVEKNLANAKEVFESYLQGVFANPGEGWEKKRFDEVCVLQRGFDLPTHARNEGAFPLVSSNGITDRIDLWKVKAPGVVTGRSGTIGNVHFIEEDFWPLNTALYIKSFNGNHEKFVYYFLKQFDLGKYSSGAGVPTLNRNNVHSEKVFSPKVINEQKRIVAKLDALYSETKKLETIYRQKLASLEELKKSLLQKAFSGELTGTVS